MTPLMYASKKGHVGAIKVLLEHGADINKQEQRGFSVSNCIVFVSLLLSGFVCDSNDFQT